MEKKRSAPDLDLDYFSRAKRAESGSVAIADKIILTTKEDILQDFEEFIKEIPDDSSEVPSQSSVEVPLQEEKPPEVNDLLKSCPGQKLEETRLLFLVSITSQKFLFNFVLDTRS